MAEKTEKKSGGGQIIKLALVLFAVSAIMALALGLVNELTKDTIAMRAAETTKKAYANVLAADEYTEQADFENDGTITKLSTATTGGQQAGSNIRAQISADHRRQIAGNIGQNIQSPAAKAFCWQKRHCCQTACIRTSQQM